MCAQRTVGAGPPDDGPPPDRDSVDPADTLAVLEAAREWLDDPEHWTTKTCFRDASGNDVSCCALARRTCAQGAMALVTGISVFQSFGPLSDCFRALAENGLDGRTIAGVNDNSGYRAVISGYDKAIAAERARLKASAA